MLAWLTQCLRHGSATETPASFLQNPDNLLFRKAVALHALVLVMRQSELQRINPKGQCHRLFVGTATKPNGLYSQKVQRERGFESTIQKSFKNKPQKLQEQARSFRILASYELEGAPEEEVLNPSTNHKI
jgi:hypothetical protein